MLRWIVKEDSAHRLRLWGVINVQPQYRSAFSHVALIILSSHSPRSLSAAAWNVSTSEKREKLPAGKHRAQHIRAHYENSSLAQNWKFRDWLDSLAVPSSNQLTSDTRWYRTVLSCAQSQSGVKKQGEYYKFSSGVLSSEKKRFMSNFKLCSMDKHENVLLYK